jgi:hypothetical protein
LAVSKDRAVAVSHLRNTPITGKSYTTSLDAASSVEALRVYLADAGKWWQDSGPEERAKYVHDLLARMHLTEGCLSTSRRSRTR